MPNISDMNIVLGQGSAIKQMGTSTEQNAALNGQFIAQTSDELKKKEKARVKNIEDTYKTQIGSDNKKRQLPSPSSKHASPPEKHKATNTSGGIFVDIKV